MVEGGSNRMGIGIKIWSIGLVGWFWMIPTVSGQIIGESGPGQLNVLFLIECVAIFVVVIGIFFFWNRLLGACLGFVLRLLLWRSSQVWISIDSIQFSPLAGRILFKNLRYHSSNLSLRILKGHITWRYWKWIVRGEGTSLENEKKGCRCSIDLEGFECFLFNRTPAFDAIVTKMQGEAEREREGRLGREKETRDGGRDGERDGGGSASGSSENGVGLGGKEKTKVSPASLQTVELFIKEDFHRWRMPWTKRKDKKEKLSGGESYTRDSQELQTQPTNTTASTSQAQPLDPPVPIRTGPHLKPKSKQDTSDPAPSTWQWQRDVFPLELIVSTGSIVIGSDATPTVVIAEFQYAKGCYQTAECRSKWDLYRQVADFKVSEVKILVRSNPDYTGALLDHGKKAYEELMKQEPSFAAAKPALFTPRAAFHTLSKQYRFLASPYFSKPPTYGAGYYGPDHEWRGLARYRSDEPDLSSTAPNVDYAKVTTLLVSPELEISYFTDVPGVVPPLHQQDPAHLRGSVHDFGNGDLPPEWGVDCVVYGGTLNYGPWADRQRAAFMKAFLPSIFYNSTPTRPVEPGMTRIHTEMRTLVELRNETILRMPTRESSKDWMFPDTRAESPQRKYGWLDVVVGANSSVRYIMPIVGSKEGYNSILELHLDKLLVRSSVNYEAFLNAKSCRLFAQMPAPLQWDARRDWVFDLSMDRPDAWLLRDHVTLIGDLAKDWSTGPTGDFYHFVPMDYQFNVTLMNYSIRLYLNDFNIIDTPQSEEANSFLIISAPRLSANVEIPLIRYRPESTTIPFSITAPNVELVMTVPVWHTHYTHVNDRTRTLATIKALDVRGTYLYYSSVAPDHVETLNMVVQADSPRLKLFGWAIRRFLLVKDNYFGSYNSYKTTYEFMEGFNRTPREFGDAIEKRYRPGKSDIFEVNLDVQIRNGHAIASRELYDFREGISVVIPSCDVHLRTQEASLELMVSTVPIGIRCASDAMSSFSGAVPSLSTVMLSSDIRLDSLEIRAHRLFGPPPRTSTYLCLWEIGLGKVTGSIDPILASHIKGVLIIFGYLYPDEANAPLSIYQPPIDPDITFVNLRLDSLELDLDSSQHAKLRCVLPSGLGLSASSAATRMSSSRRHLEVPVVELYVLLPKESKSRAEYVELGYLKTGVTLDIFAQASDWLGHARRQQAFVKAQDERTHRLAALYGSSAPAAKRHGPYAIPVTVSGRLSPDAAAHPSDVEAGSSSVESHSSDSEVSDDSLHARKSRASAAGILARAQDLEENTSEGTSSTTSADDSVDYDDSARRNMDLPHNTALPPQVLSYLNQYRYSAFRLTERYRKTFSGSLDEDVKDNIDSGLVQDVEQATATPHLADEGRVRFNAPEASTLYRIDFKAEIYIKMTPQAVATLTNFRGEFSIPGSSLLDGAIANQRHVFGEQRAKAPSATRVDLTIRGIKFASVQPQVASQSAFTDFTPTALILKLRIGRSRLKYNALKAHNRRDVALHVTSIVATAGSRYTTSRQDPSSPAYLGLEASQEHAQLVLRNLQGSSVRLESGRPFLTLRCGGTKLVGEPLAATLWASIPPWIEALGTKERTPSSGADDRMVRLLDATFCRANLRVPDGPFMGISNSILQLPAIEEDADRGSGSLRDDPGWKVLHHVQQALGSGLLEDHVSIPGERPDEISRQAIVDGVLRWRGYEFERADVETLKFLPNNPTTNESEGGGGASDSTATDMPFPADICASLENIELWVIHLPGQSLRPLYLQSLRVESIGRHIAFPQSRKDTEITANVSLRGLSVSLPESLLGVLLRVRELLPKRDEQEFTPSARQKSRRDTMPTKTKIRGSLHLEKVGISATVDSLRLSLGLQDTTAVLSGHLIQIGTGSAAGDSTAWASLDFASSSMSCNGIVNGFSLELSQSLGQSSRGLLNLLLFVRLSQLGSLVAIDSDPSKHDCQPRVALQARGLRLGSRQTPPRLWTLIQAWHQNNHGKLQTQVESLLGQTESSPEDHSGGVKANASLLPAVPVVAALDLRLEGSGIDVQVSDSVNAFWELGRTSVHGAVFGASVSNWNSDLAIFLGSQIIGFSKARSPDGAIERVTQSGDVLIRLPMLAVESKIKLSDNEISIRGKGALERFEGIFKSSIIDRLLSVYKAIGSEIRTILELRESLSQAAQGRTERITIPDKPFKKNLDFDVVSKGIRVTLAATHIASALSIEADGLEGKISLREPENGNFNLAWDAAITALQLSLGSLRKYSTTGTKSGGPSSFMVVDLTFKQRPLPQGPEEPEILLIQGLLKNAHCVMQIAALSEAYDLLNSWSADLAILREKRHEEWDSVVADTEKLIRQDKVPTERERDSPSWQDRVVLGLELRSIAVAIPMKLDLVEATRGDIFPALLLSIEGITVNISKGESGRIEMRNLLIQFVPLFDPSRKEHFDGLTHSCGNRMHLPLASLKIRTESHKWYRDVWLRGAFNDFELRLDVDIATYCRLLLEIYAQGKERIDQLSRDYPLDTSQLIISSEEADQEVEGSSRADKDLVLRTSLTFSSGTVNLGRNIGTHTGDPRRRHQTDHGVRKQGYQDTVKLPGVALWVEFKGQKALIRKNDDQAASILEVGIIIEASANVLRPSIISFVSGVMVSPNTVNALKPPVDQKPMPHSPKQVLRARIASEVEQDIENHGAEPRRQRLMDDIRVSLSLRIDQSRLTLLCAQDSEVMAELAWETGGLTVQKMPKGMHLLLSASVPNVAINVRHAFLSNQNSMHGSLGGLTASAVIPCGDSGELQIIVDSSLDLRARLGRIQDLLCLKAVWMDRLSSLEVAGPADDKPKTRDETAPCAAPPTRPPDRGTSKRLLFRLKTLDLGVDLSLARLRFCVEPIILKASVDGPTADSQSVKIDLILNRMVFASEGTLAGRIANDRIAISSQRAARVAGSGSSSDMMRLTIQAEDLVAVVDHEGQGVARLELQPCLIELRDHWQARDEDQTSQIVDLNFQIGLGSIDGVLCVFALPALLDTAERIVGIWERQVETARSESAAYRAHLLHQPDTVAAVTKVLQDQADYGALSAVTGCTLRVAQDLGLTTSQTRIGLFTSTFEDRNVYLFESSVMKFNLKRDQRDTGEKHRDLHGKLLGTQFRRWTSKASKESRERVQNARSKVNQIISGQARKVVALPNTDLFMGSVEDVAGKVLRYDYDISYRDSLQVEFELGIWNELHSAYKILQEMRSSKLATVSGLQAASNKKSDGTTVSQKPSLNRQALRYEAGKRIKLALPAMSVVGETANDLIGPYIDKYIAQAPQATHEYIVTPLEQGMDILLHVWTQLLTKGV